MTVCPGPPPSQLAGDGPLLPYLVPAQRPTLQGALGHPHHQHPLVSGGAHFSPGTVDMGCDGKVCASLQPQPPHRGPIHPSPWGWHQGWLQTGRDGLPSPTGLPASVLLSSQPRAHECIRNREFSYSPHPSGCILGKRHVGE